MSTTIDIIPVDTTDITFGQVLETSEKNINDFLVSIGVPKRIRLNVNIHDNDENYVRDIQRADKFEWKDNEYVWFSIDGIGGGTDAYYRTIKDCSIDEEEPWWWLDDLELYNKTIDNLKEKIEKAKLIDRAWYFRRSVGQHGMITISYGLISASVAQLTNGILFSGDGAWDHERFPSDGDSFLEWYFRPDKALKESNADWARDCICEIKEVLSEPIEVMNKQMERDTSSEGAISKQTGSEASTKSIVHKFWFWLMGKEK